MMGGRACRHDAPPTIPLVVGCLAALNAAPVAAQSHATVPDVSGIFTEWCLETEAEWQALAEQRASISAENPLYVGMDMGNNLRVVHAYPEHVNGSCSLSIAAVASNSEMNASAERVIPQMELYADALRTAPGWTVLCDRRREGVPVDILLVETDEAEEPRLLYLWALDVDPPGAPTVIASTYRVTADDHRLTGC